MAGDTIAHTMIPLRLSVRNFLCYRDDVPPLDLRGIHVACLCGANGHGKSALLDAMTWCLWGQARTGTQNHSDLIAYGESECRVELDFLARGQEHRAIRRRRRAGQGRTEVDLFVLDDDAQPRSMSGNSVRETNWKIQNLVGMDYTTFVNTAFLLQGRSDEFTRKTPSERKAVLSSVLNLGLYETLQGSAAGHRDHWQSEVIRTEGALTQNRSLLETIPDPTAELGEITTRLCRLGAEIEAATAKAEQLRDTVAGLLQKQAEAVASGDRIDATRTDIEQSEAAASNIAERIANADALANRAAEICAGAGELKAAQTEMERLQASRAEHDRLRNRRMELQAAIDQAGAQLTAEAAQLKRHVDDVLQPAAARSDVLSQELQGLAESESSLAVERSALETKMAEAVDVQREVALGQADLDRCISEGKDLRAKQREMHSADAVCPLCRTPLSVDACGDIAAWYEEEIRSKLTRHEEIKQSLHQMSARLEELQVGISRSDASLSQRQQRLQQTRGRLEQAQQQSAEAAQHLATALPRLERLQKALADDDFAGNERGVLAQVETAMDELGYDERALDEAIATVRSLQHWDREMTRLQDARARLPDDEASLAQTRSRLCRLGQELEAAETALDEARTAAADLPEKERDAADADQALANLLTERDGLLARQGRLQGDAERRASYLEEIGALENRRSSSAVEQGVYCRPLQRFRAQRRPRHAHRRRRAPD